jgi:hypothetical protein
MNWRCWFGRHDLPEARTADRLQWHRCQRCFRLFWVREGVWVGEGPMLRKGGVGHNPPPKGPPPRPRPRPLPRPDSGGPPDAPPVTPATSRHGDISCIVRQGLIFIEGPVTFEKIDAVRDACRRFCGAGQDEITDLRPPCGPAAATP